MRRDRRLLRQQIVCFRQGKVLNRTTEENPMVSPPEPRFRRSKGTSRSQQRTGIVVLSKEPRLADLQRLNCGRWMCCPTRRQERRSGGPVPMPAGCTMSSGKQWQWVPACDNTGSRTFNHVIMGRLLLFQHVPRYNGVLGDIHGGCTHCKRCEVALSTTSALVSLIKTSICASSLILRILMMAPVPITRR